MIHKEYIGLFFGTFVHGGTDIDVQKIIIIDVDYGDARFPFIRCCNASGLGNIGEFKISLIEVQFVGYLIAGKKEIGLIVVVKITNSNSPSIKDILTGEDIETVRFHDLIIERNPGMVG